MTTLLKENPIKNNKETISFLLAKLTYINNKITNMIMEAQV